MFGVPSVSLEETLELLQQKKYHSRYTPFTLINTLKDTADKQDQEGFNQLADAYVDYIQQIGQESETFIDKKEALNQFAAYCLYADLGWLVAQHEGERPRDRYERPDLYEETMNAFATYMGKKGFELVFELWPEDFKPMSKVN